MEVISKEMIKPSSPTPPHLKTMKRSYLDVLLHSTYVPLIFFYQHNNDEDPRIASSRRLKESLSHTLTSFYPLAGRIQDNHTVDCNDSGVEFIEARIHAQLKDSMQNPDAEALKQYLPSRDPAASDTALFLVQVNFFDCRGIAVGVLFSHDIADFASMMVFVKAWAEATTSPPEINEKITPPPSFELAKYFPCRELPDFGGSFFDIFMSDEKFTVKRLVFDKQKLHALREAHVADAMERTSQPTRVELVSAFIWKNLMHAESINNCNGERAVFMAYHAVNLRPRKIPPRLFENVFGNCMIPVFAVSDSTEGLEGLVRKLRSAFRRIDDDYITGSQSGDIYVNDVYGAYSSFAEGETGYVGFRSWCGFPVYEVDFGWGKPVWVSTSGFPFKNLSVLMNSKCGEGVEAMVNMEKDNIDFLEAKFKLL